MNNKLVRAPRAGFTLVEILIVVVILAILAAAVIPQFTDSSEDAKQSVMLHNLVALRAQTAIYQAQHGGVPPNSGVVYQLTEATNADGTFGGMSGGTPTLGPYLSAIPANPKLADPTKQSLISVVTTDPSAKIATHGWIYNRTTGRFFSATDITQ